MSCFLSDGIPFYFGRVDVPYYVSQRSGLHQVCGSLIPAKTHPYAKCELIRLKADG